MKIILIIFFYGFFLCAAHAGEISLDKNPAQQKLRQQGTIKPLQIKKKGDLKSFLGFNQYNPARPLVPQHLLQKLPAVLLWKAMCYLEPAGIIVGIRACKNLYNSRLLANQDFWKTYADHHGYVIWNIELPLSKNIIINFWYMKGKKLNNWALIKRAADSGLPEAHSFMKRNNLLRRNNATPYSSSNTYASSVFFVFVEMGRPL